MENSRQKVFFVQKTDTGYETEGIWCKQKGEFFEIDNIPFVAKNLSLGDVIAAEFDEKERVHYFDSIITESGNSTIRIRVGEQNSIELIRKQLGDFGCETEVFLSRNIIAVNIKKETDYSIIKNFLEKGEFDGKWDYEESCLAHNY